MSERFTYRGEGPLRRLKDHEINAIREILSRVPGEYLSEDWKSLLVKGLNIDETIIEIIRDYKHVKIRAVGYVGKIQKNPSGYYEYILYLDKERRLAEIELVSSDGDYGLPKWDTLVVNKDGK